MWPSEREALAVWADELQAKGQPLGQIVATHLRAAEVRGPLPTPESRALEAEAERLRLRLAEQLLGSAVGELPQLRLRWQFGVVRGVYLDPRLEEPPANVVLEVVTKLGRRPVLRFVEQLHLATVANDPGFERALLEGLARDECVARPRRLILGRMPSRFRRLHPHDAAARGLLRRPSVPTSLLEAMAARGLTWYGRWGVMQALPWTRGDHGSRLQKLEQLLADPWTPAHADTIAQALWDTSVRVRRRALAALPELPDAAAPCLLAALAIELDGRHQLDDAASRCVARIAAERPSWVAAAASEFSLDEPWVAQWLAKLDQTGIVERARARPRARIEAMLARLEVGGIEDYRRHGLRRALDRLGPDSLPQPDTPPEDETIAELLAKRGEHLGPK